MATNEDANIAEKGVVVLFTEKISQDCSGLPTEIVEIPEMTVVNRAMVNPIGFSSAVMSGCTYPVMMSGGCSGNAITIGWAVSGCIAAATGLSGEVTFQKSGNIIGIIAAGH